MKKHNVIFAVFLFLLSPLSAAATIAPWDPNTPQIIRGGIDRDIGAIHDIYISGQKSEVLESVLEKINDVIAPRGSEPAFVTNYVEYFADAEREATSAINDIVTIMTRGCDSSTNCEPIDTEGLENEPFKTYEQRLAYAVQLGLGNIDTGTREIRLSEFCDNPQNLFGNPECFAAYVALPPQNDILGAPIFARALKAQIQEDLEQAKQTEVIAGQGFLGTENAPGSLLAQIAYGAVTLPLLEVATAGSEAESQAAEVVANIAIQKIVEQGVGNTEGNFSQSIGRSSEELSNATQAAIADAGFGTVFEPGGGAIYESNPTAPPTPSELFVFSMRRQNPSEKTVAASEVAFRVAFSLDVNTIDAADFVIAPPDDNDNDIVAEVREIQKVSERIYDVVVNVLSGTGQLGLDIINDHNIATSDGKKFNDQVNFEQEYVITQ